MPTTAERQALGFLAVVALLGGGARGWSSYQQSHQSGAAASADGATHASAESVGDQLAAVDSARTSKRGSHAKARGGAKASNSASGASASRKRADNGRLKPPVSRGPSEGLRGDDIVVDADVASVTQLQMLPRISPLLAERIVANRDSMGAFGSLSALGRVRGMSVEIRNEIRNLVVFTGEPRAIPRRAPAPAEPRVSPSRAAPRASSSRATRDDRVVTSRTKKRN